MEASKLAAFALVTGITSLIPGPQMLYVLTQSAWRGTQGGLAALAGLQLGNFAWFAMAGLGLGTVAKTWPIAFTAMTVAGGLYLSWLGLQALCHAGVASGEGRAPRQGPSRNAVRDSLAVALSNPKSLVYVLALLPPFIDQKQAMAPQILTLAAIAIFFDLIVGIGYIAAGSTLAKAMERGNLRRWLDRGVGTVFLLLAAGIVYNTIASGS
jgi:homoserine/homoserine lactone efflux protein